MTKIIQLIALGESTQWEPRLIALCEDGTVHRAVLAEEEILHWRELKPAQLQPGEHKPTRKGNL